LEQVSVPESKNMIKEKIFDGGPVSKGQVSQLKELLIVRAGAI
jgi:hypothetical protein